MDFLNWFKKTGKTDQIGYWPGGRILGVKLIFDPDTDEYTYRGRYGVGFSFFGRDVHHTEIKEVSRTHSVVLVQGESACIATFDVLPLQVCQNVKEWIDSQATVAYDYEAQGKGKLVNISPLAPPEEVTAAAPQPAAAGSKNQDDPFEALKKLKELLDLGAITEAEFEEKKKEFLEKM